MANAAATTNQPWKIREPGRVDWMLNVASMNLHRVAAMPACDSLECRAGAYQRGFVQIGGHKLECDRQPGCRKAAGQRDGGMAGHVEGAGIFLQSGNQLRLLAERPYHGERQGRE